MSAFNDDERSYLLSTDRPSRERLARIATVGADGTPHVTPVGWSYNTELDTIDIGGRDFARTKKFRDVQRSERAAMVVDDVLPPWRPRGIEVRGRAEAVDGPTPLIRIYPDRVRSWGLQPD
ncbi:PPOX class F420-dependent oxidoreductase [Phytoactinopolyspora endophytica]|uniref:PPOX class F420-dependent oxidoreductase n=1 Tax=Phytoactinopolyspora endophytica TaxID=1642495 RepID=UPI00101CB038|nr:PPOX class F420-dependent oxidoreductase [Phytoactinopolyspora endophytica]